MQTSIFCFVPEISILLKPKTFYCHCQTQSSQNSPWRELGRVAWLILLLSKPAAWWQYGCLRLDIFSLVLLFFLPAKLAFFQTAGRLVQRCLGLSSLTALSHAAATFALSLAESRRPMHCKLRGCFFCIIFVFILSQKRHKYAELLIRSQPAAQGKRACRGIEQSKTQLIAFCFLLKQTRKYS